MILLRKKLTNRWQAPMLALLSVVGLSSQAQVNLSNGLEAYWSFEGNFKDSVGVYDGTGMGANPIPYVEGKSGFGKAISLDGEDQFVEITGGEPDDLAFEGGSVSISGWFKVGTFDTSWQAIVAKGEGSNWRVARAGDANGIAYAGGLTDTPGTKAVNDGAWHHFVAISDSTGAEFGTRVYLDGVVDGEIAGTAALAANGARTAIGENPGAVGRQFEGELDDIAIWGRVLTKEEVEFLYANGVGKPLSSIFGVRAEILGVDAESLLGKDLTDPEDDGEDVLGGATSPTWNWVGITSSHEPDFEGGENAFNIFDNKVGGGNAKWCCDDPTAANPVWVSVQFANPVSISHFTVTSGNDTPDRDPTDWAIQGSSDGNSFTDIYHSTTTPVPWTARNQVVKFTLPEPSAPYRYIRYIAYATPTTAHQLNEIEYFGSFGTGNVGFISGVRNTLSTFEFRLNDSGTSLIDPASVGLVFDGATIPLGTLAKVDGKIDVKYTSPSLFLPGSTHTYSITSKDNFGNPVNSTGSFTTIRYAYLTASEKVTPVTAKPGFIFDVVQNTSFQGNDNTRPVQQLAGILGVNNADPAAQGPAIAPGTPGANANLPIRFEVDTVINMNQDEGGGAGNALADSMIPGIPGLGDGPTDGIAAAIDTYIELPAGLTTMIFNSDDGFRTTAGSVADLFKPQFAGEFVGGRGSADTAFTVYAETAGVYPFRTIWYEGGGGANLEWLTVKPDGTKVLINDTANGGLKAYREAVGGGLTFISSISPAPGATGVAFDTSVSVSITEGADVVDTSSVKLSVDGTDTGAVATKAGKVTTITFKPASFLAPRSVHPVSITFKAGANTRTESWQFTVANYGTLTASHKAVSVDTTKAGFLWNIFQNETYTHTSLAQTEAALAGNLMNGTTPVTANQADPAAVGVALANGVKVNNLFKFEIAGTINLSQAAGEANGNFPDDGQMPGIPGTGATAPTDGIDVELITYVDLPAGVVSLGVNSDDGFRVQAGYINAPGDGLFLGEFDGGRGASDTIFKVNVTSGGLYPIRIIYNEGGGGANIEFFSVKADGTKVLVNDTANGGLRAYRVGVAPAKPAAPPQISVARGANGSLTVTFEGSLEVADSILGPWTVQAGTSPLTLQASEAKKFARSKF